MNLIVDDDNHAPIAMSMSGPPAARPLGVVVTTACSTGSRWRFPGMRPYFRCATHSLPGQMPLEVTIRDSTGETIKVLRRD